jgi:hypothetical protein
MTRARPYILIRSGAGHGEVRSRDLGRALPDQPDSDLLTELDGYLVCDLGI